MPEMMFLIRWPDASQTRNYSPSLIIRDYFTPGQDYPLADFLTRAREALGIASDRVQAKFGFPCSRARATLAAIETNAARYREQPDARITILEFS